jgi:hypothetical protein
MGLHSLLQEIALPLALMINVFWYVTPSGLTCYFHHHEKKEGGGSQSFRKHQANIYHTALLVTGARTSHFTQK